MSARSMLVPEDYRKPCVNTRVIAISAVPAPFLEVFDTPVANPAFPRAKGNLSAPADEAGPPPSKSVHMVDQTLD